MAIGDRLLHRVEHPRIGEHHVGAARGRTCIRIWPAVARSDQPHIDKPEIEHRPRRLADVFARLRADEDDGGRLRQRAAHPFHASLTEPAKSSKRSEEHTSELQSLMRISYAVFCMKQNSTQYTQ